MIRDNVKEYYLVKDFNCAETTMHIINEQYKLGLSSDDIKLMSGFGAGFGCGHTCGVLCAGIAALGRMCVDQRAHNTSKFGSLCADYVREFEEHFGNTMCSEIIKMYKKPEVRCLATVEEGVELLESYVNRVLSEKGES